MFIGIFAENQQKTVTTNDKNSCKIVKRQNKRQIARIRITSHSKTMFAIIVNHVTILSSFSGTSKYF